MADREEIAHALGLWREGERLLQRHTTPGWIDDYQQAAARALGHLERYTTMAELVAASFADPASGMKERWFEAACQTGSGRVLSVGIVEDAAFWRRAQALIAAGQGTPDAAAGRGSGSRATSHPEGEAHAALRRPPRGGVALIRPAPVGGERKTLARRT